MQDVFVIQVCQTCQDQELGNPFGFISVDYFGPLYYKPYKQPLLCYYK